MEAAESYIGGYYNTAPITELLQPKKRIADQKALAGDGHFAIDDLLDFPNDDDVVDETIFINDGLTANDSCNSSISGGIVSYQCFADSHFSGDLCVPHDELAELEWLSNFVEDSFSTEQSLQSNNLHIISGVKALHPSESSSSESYPESIIRNNPTTLTFESDAPLPGKARSKRSRAAPGDWSTRFLNVSPTNPQKKEKNPNPSEHSGMETMVRKCLHCAAEKTPQWRTGPMGPKTLCNACGVRYKSGRLVPEYRPAASPTFVPTKHSNSHRKVLELRRQKEMHRVQHQQFLNQPSIFGVSNGTSEDFIIHHHNGPKYRQMM